MAFIDITSAYLLTMGLKQALAVMMVVVVVVCQSDKVQCVVRTFGTTHQEASQMMLSRLYCEHQTTSIRFLYPKGKEDGCIDGCSDYSNNRGGDDFGFTNYSES
jgi:hypothetical protein